MSTRSNRFGRPLRRCSYAPKAGTVTSCWASFWALLEFIIFTPATNIGPLLNSRLPCAHCFLDPSFHGYGPSWKYARWSATAVTSTWFKENYELPRDSRRQGIRTLFAGRPPAICGARQHSAYGPSPQRRHGADCRGATDYRQH